VSVHAAKTEVSRPAVDAGLLIHPDWEGLTTEDMLHLFPDKVPYHKARALFSATINRKSKACLDGVGQCSIFKLRSLDTTCL
jgi:hypothetical protein